MLSVLDRHLKFWHRYQFEDGFDGGAVEVSTDGGATWVDVLAGGGNFGSLGKALLKPILHRLDVVICRALDRLDALGVGDREVARSGSIS